MAALRKLCAVTFRNNGLAWNTDCVAEIASQECSRESNSRNKVLVQSNTLRNVLQMEGIPMDFNLLELQVQMNI